MFKKAKKTCKKIKDMATKKYTTTNKPKTPRRDYLTSKEKQALRESLNKVYMKFRKKRESLRPGSYDYSYMGDTIEYIKKAHDAFGNIW